MSKYTLADQRRGRAYLATDREDLAPGNARSLRAFLAEGFVPLGSEVIILPTA